MIYASAASSSMFVMQAIILPGAHVARLTGSTYLSSERIVAFTPPTTFSVATGWTGSQTKRPEQRCLLFACLAEKLPFC